MMIGMTPQQVLAAMRAAGAVAPDGIGVDEELIVVAVRRAAAAMCPCSIASLSSSLAQNMAFLPGVEDDKFRERVEDVVEQMVIHGDLLELNQLVAATEIRGAQIHAAPFTFVRLAGDVTRLVGIAPDEIPLLPAALAGRVVTRGLSRTIVAEADEELPGLLRDFGVPELSVEAWLRTPARETSAAFVERIEKRLRNAPASGDMQEIEILDWTRQAKSYRRRWAVPSQQSGMFVARRPQAYGAPLWGAVDLADGRPEKFLDFPLKGDPFRGCDMAWRLQMAIDANRGEHQTYRADAGSGVVRLRFYSPIPAWAQRRLVVLGDGVVPKEALIDINLPQQEGTAVERYLSDLLWLKPVSADDGQANG
jgi:hypothetical protein